MTGTSSGFFNTAVMLPRYEILCYSYTVLVLMESSSNCSSWCIQETRMIGIFFAREFELHRGPSPTLTAAPVGMRWHSFIDGAML